MATKISNTEVSEFYDTFRKHQEQLGVNIRHRRIYHNLLSGGLVNSSNVLEIGCGIGTVSSLILKTVHQGKFTGVDISEASIKLAREINAQHKNASFVVNDMSTFTSDTRFDFVVFPDVLEHIPFEQHRRIFETIGSVTAPSAKIHINIPSPAFQIWLKKHQAEKMQIIDQSLSLSRLTADAASGGFELQSAVPYSLHYKQPDYVYLVFEKKASEINFTLKSWISRGMQNWFSKFV
jgi:trans-aconitate 2-methyltransferase